MYRRRIFIPVFIAIAIGWSLQVVDRDDPFPGAPDESANGERGPANLTGNVDGHHQLPESASNSILPKDALPNSSDADADETQGRIRVRVVDDRALPVEGVEIRERYSTLSSGLETRPVGRSDINGVALVEIRDSESVLIVGDSDRWHCSEALSIGKNTDDLVFHVVKLTVIHGTVLTASDEPSRETIVWGLYLDRNAAPGKPTLTQTQFGPTGPDGQFTARAPPYVSELTLTASLPDGSTVRAVIDPREQSSVVLQPRTLGIHGVVTSAKGPVELFQVTALPVEDGRVEDVFVGEDDFSVFVSSPGRYVLLVEPLASTGLASPDPLEVVAPVEELCVTCRRGESLMGTVEGERVEGFWVAWTRHRSTDLRLKTERDTRTTIAGEFTLSGLSEGDTLLYVYRTDDDRYGLMEGVRLPQQALRVTLRQGRRLGGRVVGYSGRNGFDLHVGLTWRGPTRWATVQEDGSFSIKGLPPGRYGLMWARGAETGIIDREVSTSEPAIELVLPAKALAVGAIRPR